MKSRLLRLAVWAVLAWVLLMGVAWLAVPPLLKWQLETRGSALLGRELRLDAVEFVPPTLALTLRGLSVGAAPGSDDTSPQLRVERLFVDLDARSLLRLAPVVAALEIDAPRLRLTRLPDGRSDVDDLLQRFASAPSDPAAEPARFALFNLRLSDGEVLLDDRVVGRQHALRQIALGLPFLSNLPAHVQVTVEPRLAFELNGSHFDNRGRATPFAQGRASELQVRFEQFDLGPLWAYAPASLPVKPTGGRLTADLTLSFQQPDRGDPQLGVKGRAALDDLGLQLAKDTPLLSWRSLRVALADVRPLQHRVALDSVQIDGMQLHLRRDAQGRIELQQLAGRAAPADAASAPASPAGGTAANWQLQIGSVELKQAQVHWSDAAVRPAAELQLDGLSLQLKTLHWPADTDATLQLDGGLSAQGTTAGKVHAEGRFTDRQAKLGFSLADVDLAPLAGPYLQQYLRPQASARIAADGTLEWARGDADRLALLLSSLRVDDFRLAEPAAARAKAAPVALAQWARLEFADLRADLLQQRLAIGRISLHKPQAELARDAAGALNVQQWLKEADTPATRAVEAGPPWRLELRDFKLDDGRVRLADAALPAGPLELGALRITVQGLAWPAVAGAAPLGTQLSATLSVPQREAAAPPARLDWRGRVGLQPLAAKGQLRLERLPVHVFEPYFGAQLPVVLQRLEAGFQGQVDLQQPAGAAPMLRLQGDALLADLRVLGRTAGAPAAGSELLSWNALNLNGLDLDLQPGAKPRIAIQELRLADFFSRLEITEEGRFNLQTVAAQPPQAAMAAAPPASAPAPTVAPAPVAASGAADTSVLSRLPVELLIEGMQFSNGRIDFRDRFIRPNYSADLSELNGRIGRLDSRSRDMATLQFSGRVAGTGLLEVGGALNPTVIPPALDIQAKARDIELPGLTPYSSKYAGYPIERGKLSMSVAYKVEADGKLEASNQIIVNQLTFGPKTDSPDATKLPVPLVVALLQDKNGVIDLDIPLTGSINDPQFSLGALVWKVIVNLFTKIVSAPFSVIGGGGKDLSHVDFRPGTAQITDGSQDVLAKVAKALDDRPALKLGVVATADPVSERSAMQQAAFEARLQAEQRRDRARGALGSGAVADAPLPPLSAEQRAALVKQIYADTQLPDKPRNLIGMAKDIPVAEMESMLVAAMPADEALAKDLATRRGRTVRELLMAKGLGSERLFLGEPKLRGQEGNKADNAPWTPQAQLTLSAN